MSKNDKGASAGVDDPILAGTGEQDLEPKTGAEDESWEEKFNKLDSQHKVLQGKYNSEVPRYAERARYLENLLATLNTEKPAPPTIAPTADPDEEEFKKEYPDVHRMMNKILDRERENIRREFEDKVGSVTKETAASLQHRALGDLTRMIPNWREINNDPEFMSWLQVKDRFNAYTRHENLLMAWKAMDMGTVAEFFKGYLEAKGGGGRDLSKITSPATGSRTHPGDRKVSGKIYTQAEVSQFYKSLATNGGQPMTQEQRAMEKDILKAMEEGRISD